MSKPLGIAKRSIVKLVLELSESNSEVAQVDSTLHGVYCMARTIIQHAAFAGRVVSEYDV